MGPRGKALPQDSGANTSVSFGERSAAVIAHQRRTPLHPPELMIWLVLLIVAELFAVRRVKHRQSQRVTG